LLKLNSLFARPTTTFACSTVAFACSISASTSGAAISAITCPCFTREPMSIPSGRGFR
jgi:hypothetical protein